MGLGAMVESQSLNKVAFGNPTVGSSDYLELIKAAS